MYFAFGTQVSPSMVNQFLVGRLGSNGKYTIYYNVL